MAVKVSKPKVNIREKLTELDIPKGVHGTQLVASSSAAETFDIVKAGRKNLLLNGEMRINQRGNVTGVTGNGYGGPDRWKTMLAAGGTWDISQDTDVPIGQGFTKSWKLDCTTADAAVDAGDYFLLEQRIEANRMAELCWGTARAKPATLSFWVKSSVTGDGNAMFHTDGFTPTRIINQTFTIHNANEWEYKTMTFPAHGPENSFTVDNTTGMRLWIWFKAGTTWTAGTGTRNYWRNNTGNQQAPGTTINIASSTDNNLLITGVQLEVGSDATPFEQRSYEEELALCQRYCVVYGDDDEVHLGIGAAYNSTNINLTVSTPVTMRSQPAVSKVTSGGNWLQSYKGATGQNSNASVEVGEKVNNNIRVYCQTTGHSSLSTGDALWCQVLPNAKLIFSAEL